MRKFKALIFLLILVAMNGCSARTATTPVQNEPSPTYLLQHSGVLSIADKRMALRGMLQLKPQQRTARVVILNDMGMKLLVAEITADNAGGYKSKKLFTSPLLRMVPPFYAESMRCIYALFLAPQSANTRDLKISSESSKQVGDKTFPAHTIINGPEDNYTLELFLNSGSKKDS